MKTTRKFKIGDAGHEVHIISQFALKRVYSKCGSWSKVEEIMPGDVHPDFIGFSQEEIVEMKDDILAFCNNQITLTAFLKLVTISVQEKTNE